MSNDRKARLRARPHDYNVGFGKPPEEHRFKKGESGNPAGRPRGAKSGKPARPEEWLKAIVLEEAYRDITVGEGDRTVTMPMAQAVIRTLAIEAAKGKPRPQRLFTEMLSTIEQEKMEEHDGFFKTAMDYKLTWEEELERRERLGITDAEAPLPHPDHIELDIEARTVQIVGPMTKEEKVVYAHWVARKKELLAILEELQKKLKAARKHAVMKKLRNDITLTMATLRELSENPPAAHWRG